MRKFLLFASKVVIWNPTELIDAVGSLERVRVPQGLATREAGVFQDYRLRPPAAVLTGFLNWKGKVAFAKPLIPLLPPVLWMLSMGGAAQPSKGLCSLAPALPGTWTASELAGL